MHQTSTLHDSPVKYVRYSIAASIITLVMKFGAYFMTSSVGILSDALESLVNLAAALLALVALIIASRPADTAHTYGHGKAEYFSSGTEGVLILAAAGGIIYASVERFASPVPLTNLGPGLLVALAASVVNFTVARIMLNAAKRFDSITLEADARHLMTDVWTSCGMVAGLAVIIAAPQWAILDPIIACAMALNIMITGSGLLRRSFSGLMDEGLPAEDLAAIDRAVRDVAGEHVEYHGLRTRKAGARRFVEFHLLVEGDMTVSRAHDLCCDVEDCIEAKLPRSVVTIHVEPVEDGASHDGNRVGGLCSSEVSEIAD